MNNNKLLDLRDYSDLYQREIASELCISRRTYSSWETNTRIIPLKHLNTISNYYGVSMDYIMGLSKIKTSPKIKNLEMLSKTKIGKRIKQVRENNSLSLRELARELNTTSSTISAYETGKTLILTAFAYQICVKYKVSLDWLCGKVD